MDSWIGALHRWEKVGEKGRGGFAGRWQVFDMNSPKGVSGQEQRGG